MPGVKTAVLGEMYRDDITGFTGVAFSKTEFLFSCERVALQPVELKDGKPLDPFYFDVHQLTFVGGKKICPPPMEKGIDTGGPGDCAQPPECPKR